MTAVISVGAEGQDGNDISKNIIFDSRWGGGGYTALVASSEVLILRLLLRYPFWLAMTGYGGGYLGFVNFG